MIDPSLMPELPSGECAEWLQHGKRVNAFPHPARPMAERSEYDRKHWEPKGYDAAPLFTATQMQAYGLQCYQLAMERAAPIAYDAAIRYSQGYAVDFKAEFALQEKTT